MIEAAELRGGTKMSFQFQANDDTATIFITLCEANAGLCNPARFGAVRGGVGGNSDTNLQFRL